jgi:2-dehydropantoate 2-reductase
MIWVKSHDTVAALEGAAPMIGPGTIVASFQNGLGNVEAIAARVPPERVVYGVSTIGGEVVAPGQLEVPATTWDGTGMTWMGVLEGPPHRLEPLRGVFAAAGIRTEVRSDIETIVWSKLALAAPMTALAALTRLPVGGVLANPELADLQRRMTAEVVAVAQAKGIPLALDEALRRGTETYEGVPEHLPLPATRSGSGSRRRSTSCWRAWGGGSTGREPPSDRGRGRRRGRWDWQRR